MKKDTSNLDENTSDAEECDLEVVEGSSGGEEGTFYCMIVPLMRSYSEVIQKLFLKNGGAQNTPPHLKPW